MSKLTENCTYIAYILQNQGPGKDIMTKIINFLYIYFIYNKMASIKIVFQC